MIPKVIHYCWFGGNPLPELALKCIESWKKFCPDYIIKQWDESNFDIHCCKYVEEAYNAKKWAFVSDYARFNALYKEGGIYFDTDIEVIKPFDDLLNCNAFFGWGNQSLTLPVFGAASYQNCYKDILDYYNTRSFVLEDGSLDTTTIERTAVKVLTEKYGLLINGEKQLLKDGIIIYPKEYFLSTDWRTGVVKKNPLLYVIHYCDGSWIDESERNNIVIQRKLISIFGERLGGLFGTIFIVLKTNSLRMVFKKTIKKILNRR